jgi:pimeloyl-ACP methyl ester carboxylesterase
MQRMVLIDARGHGMTSAPAGDENYSWEIMADDADSILQHLGITQTIFGGLSMGGGVSLAYALRYPAKVRALILCDCAGTGVRPPGVPSGQAEMARQMEVRNEALRQHGVVEVMGYRSIAAGTAPRPVMEDETKREEWLERLSHFSVNGAIHSSRAVIMTKVEGLERVKDLTMPTLVVIGDEDGLMPAAEWLRDELPNRRYALLTGVGHATARYKPEAWRAAVEGFLADVHAGRDIRGETTL